MPKFIWVDHQLISAIAVTWNLSEETSSANTLSRNTALNLRRDTHGLYTNRTLTGFTDYKQSGWKTWRKFQRLSRNIPKSWTSPTKLLTFVCQKTVQCQSTLNFVRSFELLPLWTRQHTHYLATNRHKIQRTSTISPSWRITRRSLRRENLIRATTEKDPNKDRNLFLIKLSRCFLFLLSWRTISVGEKNPMLLDLGWKFWNVQLICGQRGRQPYAYEPRCYPILHAFS